jgi:carbon monoxide dehydrogenase subunit G
MKIANSIDIDATPEKVFYWLEHPDRAMEWMMSVTRYEIIKETPNRVGTTFREYIEEDGRGTEMLGLVTEFVSNERFTVRLEGDFTSAEVSFTLIEKGSVTQLTQSVELRFKGMLKVLSIVLRNSIKKKIRGQAHNEFSRLRALCEQDD